MIKSNELRIGNFYFFVNPMSKDDKTICQLCNWTEALDFEAYGEPIPLTPERLERLGFEEIYKSDFTIRFDCKLNRKIGAGWNLINGHFHVRYGSEKFTTIKYVHQLQNFYFTIANEELILSNNEPEAELLTSAKVSANADVMRRLSVTRKETEIFDQSHQMYAEGTSDVEPLEKDIKFLLGSENWIADEIGIWFDNMQGFWRWWCSIERPS